MSEGTEERNGNKAAFTPFGEEFFSRVDKELHRLDGSWCIIDIKIEQYRMFIDWYGNSEFDRLLTDILAFLEEQTSESGGIAGYLGMEHFGVVMQYDMSAIISLQAKTHEIISSRTHISGFTPVCGVALFDGSSRSASGYFNNASLSCEGISDSLQQKIRMYDAALHEQSEEEYRLLHMFKDALEDGEICFWLQPQYRVSNRKIVGAEALARWISKDGSMISPAVFVPILEKHGIVAKLDTFIWEAVCRWNRKRLDEGHLLIPISVNLSRADISALDVPAFFSRLLRKYELPKNSIKIEVTESAYVDNSSSVSDTVTQLQESGFMVLMDDFGSGYSSLNMLNTLHVDLIKLDAQFLRSSEKEDKKGINILESVVNMTRNLAMPIIVEGVETDEQAKFLSDLGCRYAQGFFFSRPMSVEAFEELVKDESIIDTGGFIFKANKQLHAREFLDDNIYSDAMLNNILGPVAFFNWSGSNVDMIRFNDQFFQMLGVDNSYFESIRHHIQDNMVAEDRKKMYEMMESALRHHTTGASGILRFQRPGGLLMWISLKIYFLNEDVNGKKYYASAQDVTELQFVSANLPGAYYRCGTDEDFTLLYVSGNFQKMTGFNEDEIRILFDNRPIRMIHPDDVARLRREAHSVTMAERDDFTPYRLRRKSGDYIYVAEQSHLTEHYGALCWQSVAIDVTDVMRMRNQMRILSKCLKDTVLFLRRTGEGLIYEAAIHGLASALMLDARSLELALNSGAFCQWIDGHKDIPHREYTEMFISELAGGEKTLTVNLNNGKRIRLNVRADKVNDDKSNIEYLVVMRLAE